jgi:hypothetical protein
MSGLTVVLLNFPPARAEDEPDFISMKRRAGVPQLLKGQSENLKSVCDSYFVAPGYTVQCIHTFLSQCPF